MGRSGRRQDHADQIDWIEHRSLLAGHHLDLVPTRIESNDLDGWHRRQEAVERAMGIHRLARRFQQDNRRPGGDDGSHGVGFPAVDDLQLDPVRMFLQAGRNPLREQRRRRKDDDACSWQEPPPDEEARPALNRLAQHEDVPQPSGVGSFRLVRASMKDLDGYPFEQCGSPGWVEWLPRCRLEGGKATGRPWAPGSTFPAETVSGYFIASRAASSSAAANFEL
jgi:hypothetical protein